MRTESISCDVCKKFLHSEELFCNLMLFAGQTGEAHTTLSAPQTIDVCQKCFDDKFREYFEPQREGRDMLDSIRQAATATAHDYTQTSETLL